jgi:2-keto-4-pentenoate hydratase/2-oxohepta-3-ene-1,7-dioic acid hydratase in catechol pathway
MRIARYSIAGEVAFGVIEDVDGEPTVAAMAAHPFGEIRLTGARHALADVRLLAPILPSKVLAVDRNYAGQAEAPPGGAEGPGAEGPGAHGRGAEHGGAEPAEPIVFLKPSTSVIGHRESIVHPALSERVEPEGELAVVIGRLCRDVPAGRAGEVVLGYMCANDVTARDLQRGDEQWTRAKGFDTFCPLGPWIETRADPADLAITTTVNGEIRQAARTKQLLYDVPSLVAWISQVMTLLPGDVILTGTPDGAGPLRPGDEVSVTIESIGTLTNRVVSRD